MLFGLSVGIGDVKLIYVVHGLHIRSVNLRCRFLSGESFVREFLVECSFKVHFTMVALNPLGIYKLRY